MADARAVDRPEVLFVCIHNAGRSQMAAALLAVHAGDRVVVRSAGTAPADTISPAVVEAMPSSALTFTPMARIPSASMTLPSKHRMS